MNVYVFHSHFDANSDYGMIMRLCGDSLEYKILKKKSKPIPIDRSQRAEKEYIGLYMAK